LSNWSAFFGTSFFGAPNFNSARVLFLDDKGSIHEGTRRLRMEKEYRSKSANGRGVSLEEGFEAPFLGAPTFMSAWVLLLDDKGKRYKDK